MFTINNNVDVTTEHDVTLNINIPGAVYMRFSNIGEE
jgi:hypothetical protein